MRGRSPWAPTLRRPGTPSNPRRVFSARRRASSSARPVAHPERRARSREAIIRAEAADLLACLATEAATTGVWRFDTRSLPGRWRHAARQLACKAYRKVAWDGDRPLMGPAELYAEAEARLREASRG